ncbi:carbohydrate ABC transporter permease [Occultella aeris]|uniref:L-arabinose transport system permease protein AraQ n=1 Tax=Occultella aeris TaxID=2761496 RepID=A0A7M4DKF2_9MICO|nr:carbohydrate ABC transporter permease [Occultella aeris]VZO37619.1 L-arabinose transport system permease protein AraQ [Occultella aeris]
MTDTVFPGTLDASAGTEQGAAERKAAARTAKQANKRSASTKRRISRVALTVLLIVVSFVMALPFVWMFLTSVRSSPEIFSSDMPMWPAEWHWENFTVALERAPFGIYARNSFIIAVVHTISNLVFGSMAGYALAKIRFKGSSVIFGFILASMMIPFYAIVIPEFLMIRFVPFAGGNDLFGQGGTGWYDTWWALLIPGLVSPFNIFLFRQFFISTPTELMEAARIDGASEARTFVQIMAPLIRPGMLTVALLAFEAGWNNFLWPLLVTSSTNLRTIQLGLSVFRQEAGTEFNLLMAGTTMAAVPMIVMFFFFQKQFVNGFVGSGLK